MPESLTPPFDPDQNAAAIDHRVPSRLVRLLSLALLVEALVLVVAAVVLLVDLVRLLSGADDGGAGSLVGMNVFLVLCALGLAFALVAAARSLARGRRSGRAVAMTWQLFQAVVGVSAVASGSLWAVLLGVLLLVLAVGVVVLLLTPRVVEATTTQR